MCNKLPKIRIKAGFAKIKYSAYFVLSGIRTLRNSEALFNFLKSDKNKRHFCLVCLGGTAYF
jgi:hypothetical protein